MPMKRTHQLLYVFGGLVICLVVGLTAMYVTVRIESKVPSTYIADDAPNVNETIQLPVPPALEKPNTAKGV